MSRPFDSETGKAASRLGVEARARERARKRAERAGLEDDPRKILDRIDHLQQEIVRLATKLARIKLRPSAVPSNPVPALPPTADKPAPSNGNAVAQPVYDPEAVRRRAAGALDQSHPPAGAEQPAAPEQQDATNGKTAPTAAASYVAELEAHSAERRQTDEAERERQERRARLLESRFRKW